jgi:hypothetical protein
MGIKGSNNEPQDTNDMARVEGFVRVAVEAKPGLSASTDRAGGTRGIGYTADAG